MLFYFKFLLLLTNIILLLSIGLAEDHVTGSAMCALAPYYFAKYGLQPVTAEQIDAISSGRKIDPTNHSDSGAAVLLRGYQASPRGGEFKLALMSDAKKEGESEGSRVFISGHCLATSQSTVSQAAVKPKSFMALRAVQASLLISVMCLPMIAELMGRGF